LGGGGGFGYWWKFKRVPKDPTDYEEADDEESYEKKEDKSKEERKNSAVEALE